MTHLRANAAKLDYQKPIEFLRTGAEGSISGTEGWCVRLEKHFFDIIFIFFSCARTLFLIYYARYQALREPSIGHKLAKYQLFYD